MRRNVCPVSLCLCFAVRLWIVPAAASAGALNDTELPIAGYGYEMLSAKLDFLQYKLLEMELGLKERDEELAQKQAQLENVLGSVVRSIDRLDREIGSNLTALQTESWRILAQQSACASHEQMRKEIALLAPRQEPSKNAQSLLALHGSHRKRPLRSCKDAPTKESGVVAFRVDDSDDPFEAYCEQQAFGGGWLVIQYRFDGSLDFYRNWVDYRNGFGSVYHEFWIGLERLHQLTSRGTYELMVEMKDFTGTYKYANYKEFEIASETAQYALKKLGAYDGTAGDSLKHHEAAKFTTKDQDNDENGSNCATEYEGAWWYRNCHASNLNGRYMNKDDAKSMCWQTYKSNYQGLEYSRMMIREV